jgi:heme/copper-type cytochrome/quinol oxidase subunit 2
MNRWLKRGWGLLEPIRLIKLPKILDTNDLDLLRFRFNEKNNTVLGKNTNNIYLAFKQKRYVIRKKFPIKKKFKKLITNEASTESVSKDKLRLRVLIKNNYFDTITEKSALLDYKFLKKSKKHSELIPVPLARRILRTKRTLVLPAHINLTVITNSYDVVHSWFVPSLGVKMDCVPGRSTHHVLFIDSVGFYYGQCAEICGRYHHHMPIRICALPFEHFLLWWHTYGVSKLILKLHKYATTIKNVQMVRHIYE